MEAAQNLIEAVEVAGMIGRRQERCKAHLRKQLRLCHFVVFRRNMLHQHFTNLSVDRQDVRLPSSCVRKRVRPIRIIRFSRTLHSLLL